MLGQKCTRKLNICHPLLIVHPLIDENPIVFSIVITNYTLSLPIIQ